MDAESDPGVFTRRRVSVELCDNELAITVTGDPAAVAVLIEQLRGRDAGAASFEVLTHQEAAVAALVGRALTNQQIASRLRISTHTVNFHLRQIFRKLAIPSRVHLALLARADHGGGDGDRPT